MINDLKQMQESDQVKSIKEEKHVNVSKGSIEQVGRKQTDARVEKIETTFVFISPPSTVYSFSGLC